MFTLLHENGCDIAFPAEPVGSGSLISQEMFEEWVIPSLKKLKKNSPFISIFYAHSLGASGNRVAALRECGSERIFGRYLVDFDKAVEAAGEKMVMMGNINPAGTLLTGTPSEVYKEACERIKNCKRAFSHSCPPGVIWVQILRWKMSKCFPRLAKIWPENQTPICLSKIYII